MSADRAASQPRSDVCEVQQQTSESSAVRGVPMILLRGSQRSVGRQAHRARHLHHLHSCLRPPILMQDHLSCCSWSAGDQSQACWVLPEPGRSRFLKHHQLPRSCAATCRARSHPRLHQNAFCLDALERCRRVLGALGSWCPAVEEPKKSRCQRLLLCMARFMSRCLVVREAMFGFDG